VANLPTVQADLAIDARRCSDQGESHLNMASARSSAQSSSIAMPFSMDSFQLLQGVGQGSAVSPLERVGRGTAVFRT